MPQQTEAHRRQRLQRYHRNTLLVFIAWSAAVAAYYFWDQRHDRQHAEELAVDRARTILARDFALRRWANSHGGVYVPVDRRTPPNPQLSHLPERDITTPSGRRLTLMNPAYMLRQIVAESSTPQASTHLASLKPMRQENTPDAWEAAALRAFEKGAKEVLEVTDGPSGPALRLMQPFVIDNPNCLTCHGSMGYRMGDVRGGISTTVSLSPFLSMERHYARQLLFSYGAIWLLGSGVIWSVARRNRRSLDQQLAARKQLAESRFFLEEVINGIQDLVIVIDRQYRVVLSNWHGIPDPDRYQDREVPPCCYECLHGRSSPCDHCHLERVFAGETLVLVKEEAETADGRAREITAYPYRDASGEITMAIEVVRDVQERRQMESALRASEERFRHMAEQAQDVVYRLRLLPKPAFEYVSRAVTAVTGYRPEEWLQDAGLLRRIAHPDDLPLLQDIFGGQLPEGGTFTLRVVNRGGEVIWTEHRIAPVRNQEGKVEAIDGIARDVSRQMETTRRLENFNRELERRVAERTADLEHSNRELEEFCRFVAHDLRGPLRAINSHTHLLREECDRSIVTPVCSETLEQIRRATTHMGDMMDLLLELGRLSRTPFNPELLDLSELCRRLAASLREREPEREALFTIAEGMTVTADPVLMERLMAVLLDNAWKFTAPKPVAVIEVQQSTGADETVVMVRDNGIGFDMGHAGSLFQAFRRLHRRDEFAGAGMGLAFARSIAERHGGSIRAEGEPDAGASFSVILPLSPHSAS